MYVWDFGDTSAVDSTEDPLHTFYNPTDSNIIYTVQLIATTPYGCPDTNEMAITVFPDAVAEFNLSDTAVCSPYDVTICNTGFALDNFYYWNFGGGIDDTSSTTDSCFIHTFSNIGTFQISLIVEDSKTGCMDSTVRNIEVLLGVVASAGVIGNDTTGCHPFSVDFFNTSYGADTYLWIFGDTSANSSDSIPSTHIYPNPSIDADSIYQVMFIASNPGCADTIGLNITVYPKPIADFTISDSVLCQPWEVTITDASAGGVNYYWDYDGGTGNTTDTSPTHIHTYTPSGLPDTCTIQLIVENSGGCTDTATRTLIVNPEITANFATVPDTIDCSPFTVCFYGYVSSGEDTYNWNFGDSSPIDTTANPCHTFTNPSVNADSVYTVVLIVNSKYGCSDTIQQDILVLSIPDVQFTALPAVQSLPNRTVTLTNNSNFGTGSTFFWDFGDGSQIDTTENPGTHDYPPNDYGVYMITLTITTGTCSDIDTQYIEILPIPPNAKFDIDPLEGCSPLRVTFTNKTTGVYDENIWYFGDGGINEAYVRQDSTVTHTYGPGIYTVSLVACWNTPDSTICDSAAYVDTIIVYDPAFAFFSVSPQVVRLPHQAIHCANLSENGTTYLWDFGDGNTSDEFEPDHYYEAEGVYDILLEVWTINGCYDSMLIERAVSAEASDYIAYPDAFTPNGDKLNDIFLPVYKGVIVEYQLNIFNRWGELIFVESKNIDKGWNGTYKDKLCKQDVYVWKVYVKFSNGQVYIKAGDVTLYR